MVAQHLHVVTHEKEGWAIRREGSKDVISTHPTQQDAIEAAVDMAEDESGAVLIHRRDGRIREVKNYVENGNGGDAEQSRRRENQRGDSRESALAPLGSRVRWGAVLAGFVLTLGSVLTLGVLGTALGLCLANVLSADALRVFMGVWATLTLLASLFVGGMTVSRLTVGETSVMEPSIYGAVLWGLIFAVLPMLPLANFNLGFGALDRNVSASESNATESQTPAQTQQELREAGLNPAQSSTVQQMVEGTGTTEELAENSATEIAWLTFAAILLSLLAAVSGAIVGAQMDEPRAERRVRARAVTKTA